MNVVCKKDNIFEFNRYVDFSCGCSYEINDDQIYTIRTVDYDGEDILQYYSICPICGHINIIDEKFISKKVMDSSLKKSISDPDLYKKNNTISHDIYLGMLRVRVLKR